jgi:hypothetical protein
MSDNGRSFVAVEKKVQASIDVDRLQGVVGGRRGESNPVEKVGLSVKHGLAR